MNLDDATRGDLIRHKFDKAAATAQDVRFLLDNGKNTIAVNRIYYALFYTVSALALHHQFATGKHLQLIGWFNREFVRTGRIEKRYGQILHRAFEKRSTGDYDDFAEFSREEVEQMYLDMLDSIEAIRLLLQ